MESILLRGARLNSSRPEVRLKITRKIAGSIDGIQLQHFTPGQIYDVSASFGSYLLAEQAAELVGDELTNTATPIRDRADDGGPTASRERKRS
jgi:hypothetical protein